MSWHLHCLGTEAKQTIPYFGERALLYQEPKAATVKVISEAWDYWNHWDSHWDP